MRSVIVFLSIIALAAAAFDMGPFTHHAILNGVQASTGSSYVGAAVMSFDGKTGAVQYALVNNVQGTTAAHIHGAAIVGASADPLVTIPGFDAGSNNVATGTVTIAGAHFGDFDAGRCYFNIHTSDFPNGEIRGQILAIGQQLTTLTGAADGVVTSATGVAWTSYDSSNKNLTLILSHDVQNATLAHIHGPANSSQTANPIITLAGSAPATASPIVFHTTLTSDQEGYLNQGLLYYNVHSVANPGGEIRGQILPIINYLANLDGSQDSVSTTEQGIGMAALYGTTLYGAVCSNVASPTMAHIHTGAAGVAGPVTFPFPNGEVNATGEFCFDDWWTATSSQASDLQNGKDYFNIHTAANPGGEIRGQISAKTAVKGASSSASSVVASFVVVVLAVVALMA